MLKIVGSFVHAFYWNVDTVIFFLVSLNTHCTRKTFRMYDASVLLTWNWKVVFTLIQKVESRVRILADMRDLASAGSLDSFTLIFTNILEHQPDCPVIFCLTNLFSFANALLLKNMKQYEPLCIGLSLCQTPLLGETPALDLSFFMLISRYVLQLDICVF
jgi:hypothetical protein